VDALQARDLCRSVGGRLPSDLEWEYALRKAGQDVNFPWGNADANCARAVLAGPATADAACAWTGPAVGCSMGDDLTEQGICDLVGNLSEWIESSPNIYDVRGGNYLEEDLSRVHANDPTLTSETSLKVGVRCAR
jgi:formylglycine-generating enzyme required for sulfatase activity